LLSIKASKPGCDSIAHTPTYLVGPFMTSTLDFAGFKQVVSNARARLAGK
jgi:hypothetical protein